MNRERAQEYETSTELGSHYLIQEMFTMVLKSKEPNKVVITVPHDGTDGRSLFGEELKPREKGFKESDAGVWSIASNAVLAPGFKTSGVISTVRGLMPREFIDYNRGWPEGVNYYPLKQGETETALEDARLAPIYFRYHDWVKSLVALSVQNYGGENSLLIDLHGFGRQPEFAPKPDGYDIILGTGNRQSVPHGEIDRELGQYLKDLGYTVFVSREIAKGGKEEELYAAGFTTRLYSEMFGINAIQIEIAPKFRDYWTGETLGPKLSKDLISFIDEHYSTPMPTEVCK
ncbi:MAG TPA: N-formylglutamate amidohydrolase [Candidatus Saccharimonadales bacterium]|nr:N-formylglutamate amidohydrolase [Candidatus Saccharimonadales bacterium]